MRASPCATSVRLRRSSRTTSATVPSATRSSSAARLGSGARGKGAALAQQRARRQQHVEHHADAGEMLAGEFAARLVGIDDQRRVRQRRRGQVVVGDQHLDAERCRRGDAVVARDAVVDGDDEARRACRRLRDDFRREAVAVFEPVGDDEIDDGAERPEAAHAHGARGRAVGVVVRDDEDPFAARDRVGEARRGGVDAFHRREGRQPREIRVELVGGGDAARREHARQHRMDSGGGESGRGRRAPAAARCPSRLLARGRGQQRREVGFPEPPRDACASRAAAAPSTRTRRRPRRQARSRRRSRRARAHRQRGSQTRDRVASKSIGAAGATMTFVHARVGRALRRDVRATVALVAPTCAASASGEIVSRERRNRRAPRPDRGGSVPPAESQTPFALWRPARSRAAVTGCVNSSIWISSCQRHHAFASAPAGNCARRLLPCAMSSGRVDMRGHIRGAHEPRVGPRRDESETVAGEMRVQGRDQRIAIRPR